MENFAALFKARQEALYFYSPFNFIRTLPRDLLLEKVKREWQPSLPHSFFTKVGASEYIFLVSPLPWDSEFFGLPTYKLYSVLFADRGYNNLIRAITKFSDEFFSGRRYCFIEIPPEDVFLAQALSQSGFKLVETRVHYFKQDLSTYAHPRFGVRDAGKDDTANLKRVAAQMRNAYDRFHADSIIPETKADEFLSKYIEESIQGFADVVLVPNESGVPADAFLTARFMKSEWQELGVKVSKMILSAVGASCKGWYKKLISEMTYRLAAEGAECIFMATQTTNRAVIKTWEDLGYRYANSSHILARSAG